MTCKTCDHTMHRLGTVASGTKFYWCPICGTVKEVGKGETWRTPVGWERAIAVLRRVWSYWQLRDTGDIMVDLVPVATTIEKILRDCGPERESRPSKTPGKTTESTADDQVLAEVYLELSERG